MSKQQADKNRNEAIPASGERANLDRQYGSIGISAVAAALPYVGKATNSFQAPVRKEADDRRRSVLAV